MLSPTSLIYHQWIFCNPLTSLLIVMNKIGVKLPFLGTFPPSVEILLLGNCQFDSNKLTTFLEYLDVSYIDR